MITGGGAAGGSLRVLGPVPGNWSRDRQYRRVAFLAAPEKAVSQTLRKDEQAAFNNRKSTGKTIIRFQQVSTGPDCVSGVLVRFVIQYLCGSVQVP